MAGNSLSAALPNLSPVTLLLTTPKKARLAPRGCLVPVTAELIAIRQEKDGLRSEFTFRKWLRTPYATFPRLNRATLSLRVEGSSQPR